VKVDPALEIQFSTHIRGCAYNPVKVLISTGRVMRSATSTRKLA